MLLFKQAALAANALLLALALFCCDEQEPVKAPVQIDTATVADARSATASLSNQYAFHARLFANALEGISDEEANRQINENTNSLAWIAGHTLDIQYNLAALTGVVTENPYAVQFAFGTKFDPAADYLYNRQM